MPNELCPNISNVYALCVYMFDTEGISRIKSLHISRLIPISLLLDASETDVVSSCRDVRGVGLLLELFSLVMSSPRKIFLGLRS